MTSGHGQDTRERALALFPRLRERLDQTAGTLSGGEQQMLAIARALCTEPPRPPARRAHRGPAALADRADPRYDPRPPRRRRRHRPRREPRRRRPRPRRPHHLRRDRPHPRDLSPPPASPPTPPPSAPTSASEPCPPVPLQVSYWQKPYRAGPGAPPTGGENPFLSGRRPLPPEGGRKGGRPPSAGRAGAAGPPRPALPPEPADERHGGRRRRRRHLHRPAPRRRAPAPSAWSRPRPPPATRPPASSPRSTRPASRSPRSTSSSTAPPSPPTRSLSAASPGPA